MGFKIFVVLLLVLILFSLASGFFFLIYRKSPSDKAMVNSLTLRIGLSVALFLMLFIAWYLGYIQPHPPLPS